MAIASEYGTSTFLKKSRIFEHTSVQILIYRNMVMSILGAKAESPLYKKNPAKS